MCHTKSESYLRRSSRINFRYFKQFEWMLWSGGNKSNPSSRIILRANISIKFHIKDIIPKSDWERYVVTKRCAPHFPRFEKLELTIWRKVIFAQISNFLDTLSPTSITCSQDTIFSNLCLQYMTINNMMEKNTNTAFLETFKT